MEFYIGSTIFISLHTSMVLRSGGSTLEIREARAEGCTIFSGG